MQFSPSTQFIAALGVVTAALIAGFFSYLNLISAKEQKVSEFRQAWIDQLRDAICKHIANVAYLASYFKVHREVKEGKKERLELIESIKDVYEKINDSYNSIVLRVNDKETDEEGKLLNDAFLEVLNETREHFNNNRYEEARATSYKLREVSKPLLKYEWKRVKIGEPSYRHAKLLAGITLTVGLVFTVIGGGSIAYKAFIAPPPVEVKTVVHKPATFRSNTSVHADAAKTPPRR